MAIEIINRGVTNIYNNVELSEKEKEMIRILASGTNNNKHDCQCDRAELKTFVDQAERAEKAVKQCEEISNMIHCELMELMELIVLNAFPNKEEVDPPIVEDPIYDEPIYDNHIVDESVIKSSEEEVAPKNDDDTEDADAVKES